MRVKTAMLLASIIAPLSAGGSVRLLVPAYYDPEDSTGWSTMISSESASVPITAIMNPDSGPVSTVDPAYTSAISELEAAGGQVVAYVHTTDGSRSLSSVEKDVATYKSEYPGIDGIFVDEMADTSKQLSYYKNLYNYIKSENSAWQVIGNPGTSTLATYLSPTPAAADELVTFENGSGYSSYAPSSWQSSYSSSSFANIVYGVTDVATMQSDLSLAMANGAGSVYFSDLSGTNPYNALPSYWSQEVAAVSAINAPKKASWVLAGSGDYNSLSNWSVAIPNGTDSEADFLSAITANHTVYSDTPITLGTVVFNNTKSYVLAGAGSLTLQVSTGSATVEALAGVQSITLPITLASNTVFNASGGATLVISAPITISAGQSLTEAGSGIISLLGSVTLQSDSSANLLAGSSVQSLAVGAAAHASLIAPTAQPTAALVTQSLSLAASASLDLKGQALVVQNGDLLQIEQLVRSGNASGQGLIDSSVAAKSSHLDGVGVISNSAAAAALYASFDGSAVDASDILIKSTLFGDTNLDGTIDGSDYARVNTGFADNLTGWFNGDFNYDGQVDGSDYTLMDNAYNSTNPIAATAIEAQTTSQITAVPECDGTVLLSVTISLSILKTRHRKMNRKPIGPTKTE